MPVTRTAVSQEAEALSPSDVLLDGMVDNLLQLLTKTGGRRGIYAAVRMLRRSITRVERNIGELPSCCS
jgi:hypothetical protein